MNLFKTIWVWVVVAISIAHGQGIQGSLWTNTLAFPGLSALSSPVCLASPPGETNRLFIVEQKGDIVVITNLANPTRTVFMDISSRVANDLEMGLLGLAFHPGYATNGYFYVYYVGGFRVTNSPPNSQVQQPLYNTLSRFQAFAANPNQADTNSELQLFKQYERNINHVGGDLHFGPEGYLYVAVGDEGGGGNSYHNAQYINSNLFSGILRIDVDKRPGNLMPNPSFTTNYYRQTYPPYQVNSPVPAIIISTNYTVPLDNPFVGATNFDGMAIDPTQVRSEFWAVGLREPWRFSFDPVTERLYCGDVGENSFEEINIITKGGNYGWASFEGINYAQYGDGQPAPQNPIFPIITYAHGSATNQGICVIGGVVYRGNRFPQLNGAYVFGDLSGKLWMSFYDGASATPPLGLFNDSRPTTFGIDPRNGDILYTSSTSIKRVISFKPNINAINYSGTNLVITGAGGNPSGNYYLIASTNLLLPLKNWIVVASGSADSLANFSFTNTMDSSIPTMFYRVKAGP